MLSALTTTSRRGRGAELACTAECLRLKGVAPTLGAPAVPISISRRAFFGQSLSDEPSGGRSATGRHEGLARVDFG